MACTCWNLKMPIEDLDIFCNYDVQRFTQFGSMDCANWYSITAPNTKKQTALYPAMGRKHVEYFGNQLIFDKEPRQIFKTINFLYVILDTQVLQYDKFYNARIVGNLPLGKVVWFAFLPVADIIYVMLTAETDIYVITEDSNPPTLELVTDPNRPQNPLYVASFGNRFVVSEKNSPQFQLSQINLGGTFDPATAFTIPNLPGPGFPLVNRASGVIGQFGVLHNQLYIFCTFSTDVWANIPTQITVSGETFEFPWKLNSSYNFDYGISDPFSLSVDYGQMVWLAQNSTGLVSFMASNGQRPVDISSQAVNVLLENSRVDEGLSPFITDQVNGFLYQWENTIFYRVSAGNWKDYSILDVTKNAQAIEFNFDTQKWARVIELNGERNRIQKHAYFNNLHLVTVQDDGAIYQMAGNIYRNELRTPDTAANDINAFTKFPFRYTLVTSQIYAPDYSEFITKYVQIDFVFGDRTFYRNNTAFGNTIFIIAEDADPQGCPIYLITEDAQSGEDVFIIMEEGNTPTFDDNFYNSLFKPHIELYYSDDGGITFTSADLREFSQLGQYRWLMRWYELGASRNRCYKLVCVSSAPIVILGAVQNIERVSGGAN